MTLAEAAHAHAELDAARTHSHETMRAHLNGQATRHAWAKANDAALTARHAWQHARDHAELDRLEQAIATARGQA